MKHLLRLVVLLFVALPAAAQGVTVDAASCHDAGDPVAPVTDSFSHTVSGSDRWVTAGVDIMDSGGAAPIACSSQPKRGNTPSPPSVPVSSLLLNRLLGAAL